MESLEIVKTLLSEIQLAILEKLSGNSIGYSRMHGHKNIGFGLSNNE